MGRMMKDLAVDRAQNPSAFENDTWDEDEDDGEVNVIDRGDERWPGQYIDVTRARRHAEEEINWPRPG